MSNWPSAPIYGKRWTEGLALDEPVTPLAIHHTSQGLAFSVKVVPGSSRTALAGLLDEALKVKVAAPPERGKANQCLIDFLAEQLNIKSKTITIVSGQTNPVKRLEISGLTEPELLRRLGLAE